MKTLLDSVFILALCGMASLPIPAQASDASEHRDYMNGGYYLLYRVCDDETKLPLLLVVKDTTPEIEKFVAHVGKTAKESLATLDRMQDNDARLNFDKNPLPLVEQDVRDSIKGDKQHQLLFGTSGPEFAHALLVSQIEASTYAINLAKTLADEEKNPSRVKALQRISAKWLAIREEAFRLLRD